MQPTKPYPAPLTRNSLTLFLLCVLSALSVAALLAACDNGSPSPAPPNGSSPGAIEEATPGLPRGQAVFARYCNSCHPGGGRGAGPSLIELSPGLSDDLIRDSVRKGRNRMPAYNQSVISDDALTDMIAYIRTLK
jgi:mono/diheme cytochrome c family protein